MKLSQKLAGVIRLGISAYLFLTIYGTITDCIAKVNGDFSSPTFIGENFAYLLVLLYGVALTYWGYFDIKEKPLGLLGLKLTFILLCLGYGIWYVYAGLLWVGAISLMKSILLMAAGIVTIRLAIYDIKGIMTRRRTSRPNTLQAGN